MTNIEFCNTLTEDLPPELRRWLRRATLFLGRIGIVRVVQDIRQHYSDAYSKGLEAGDSGEDAAQVAMMSLGSPHKARRRFKRAHLTLLEEDSLRSSYGRAKKSRSMYWFNVLSFCIIWANGFRHTDEDMGFLAAWGLWGGIFFILTLVSEPLSRRCLQSGKAKRAKISETIFWTVFVCFLTYMGFDKAFSPGLLGFILFFAFQGLQSLNLARKLPTTLSESDLQLLSRDGETDQ